MNSLIPTATVSTAGCSASTTCSATAAPAPIFLKVDSGTERTTAQHGTPLTASHAVPTRMTAAMRMLMRWLPMPVSSTPSAQAISTLSQRDRLGERG